MSRAGRMLFALVLALASGTALAQTRAWLDRDRIGLGETTTLNIETSAASAPDYAPLLRDFDLSGQASQQQVELANGRVQMRSLYAVALRPRRDGLLPIPALRVGGQRTASLTLLVTPAAAAVPTARGDVFIESEADDQDPYVQQSVGWVVRLYSAIPLIAGRLDQDEPDGASLQRVGEDLQFRRTIGDRAYVVTERRYLLIPERSGELVVPPARFDGRGSGNAFDRLFGDGQDALHAVGRPRILKVRPIPADAPQPWLPLRGLTLRYLETPRRAKAGGASSIAIEVTADGASAAQLPDLALQPVDGLQVFGERPTSDESMVDGRPRVRLQRRFSVVPSRAGRLALPGPRIDWWDTQASVARTAQLPAITLRVAPGAVAAPEDEARDPAPAPGITLRPRLDGRALALVLAAFALLACVGLMLRRRSRTRTAAVRDGDVSVHMPADMPSTRVSDPKAEIPAGATRVDLPSLLRHGDLAAIDDGLRRLAGAADLDGVIRRLDDAAQREAVESLRRARWAGGDAGDALGRLRSAFAHGPRWIARPSQDVDPLPPLYPGSRGAA